MKRFLRWLVDLFDLTRPEKPKTPLKPVNKSRSVLEHWQTDDERVNWARTSNEFAEILSIYESRWPTAYPLRGQEITDIQAAVELGRREGYADGRAVLMALREFPAEAPVQVEADYSQDEEKEE